MDPLIKNILTLAIRAPSGDNVQPWRFHAEGMTVRVFHNSEKETSLYDALEYPAAFAHGALMENICIAAESLGFEARFTVEPVHKKDGLVATFSVFPGKESSEARELAKAISARCTNRKSYKKTPLTEEQKKNLEASAENVAGGHIKILLGSNTALAHAVSMNEMLVFQNPHLHKPLFESIRWTDKEVQKTRDGFSIATFELPLPGYYVFKLARNWKTLSFLNSIIGLARSLPAQTATTYAAAGGYVAFTAPSIDWNTYFSAGRAIEKVWLTATQLNLSFQPITGIIFLRNTIQSGGSIPLLEEEKAVVLKAYNEIAKVFSVLSNEHVLFVGRMGWSKAATARTARKNIEELLV